MKSNQTCAELLLRISACYEGIRARTPRPIFAVRNSTPCAELSPVLVWSVFIFEKKSDTITVFKRRVIAFCECRLRRNIVVALFKTVLRTKSAAGVPLGSFCREPARRVKTYYVSFGLDRTSRLQVVGACGNAFHVTRIAVSGAVFGSLCRTPRDTDSRQRNSVLIFLL